MPVAAAVIGNALEVALIALFDVAAQSRCTTAFDGADDAELVARQRSGMLLAIGVAIAPKLGLPLQAGGGPSFPVVRQICCSRRINSLAEGSSEVSDKILAMVLLLRYFLGWLAGNLRPRQDLILENFALRQQLPALHAKHPRHRLGTMDKYFWVMLQQRLYL